MSETPSAVPEGLVEVARIAGAFGVHGWVHVETYSGDGASLHANEQWWIDGVATGLRPMRCAGIRPHGNAWTAKLEGVDERNGAAALKGARVWIPRSAFPRTASDEYYWVDLIGCEVVGQDGERVGAVEGVNEYGAHPVLAVRRMAEDAEAGEIELIPFVDAHVKSVDLGSRRIAVEWSTPV